MNDIELTKKWIQDYVIQLELCPFALKPFKNDSIEYIALNPTDLEQLNLAFSKFSKFDENKFKTVFLIMKSLRDFSEFLDFYYGLEDLIASVKQWENIKLVAFHPDYMHGENRNLALNYSNKSPLPLIQLLNVIDVQIKAKIISSESILENNEMTLNLYGEKKLNVILDEIGK